MGGLVRHWRMTYVPVKQRSHRSMRQRVRARRDFAAMEKRRIQAADVAQLDGLRPHTVRAYGYELAAAPADARFRQPLDDIRREDLDTLAHTHASRNQYGRSSRGDLPSVLHMGVSTGFLPIQPSG